MNKKTKTIIIVAVLLIIIAAAVTIFIFNKKNKETKSYEVYGVVKQVNGDSIVVTDKDANTTKTFLIDANDLKEGDLVYIRFNGKEVDTYKVIVDNYASITTNPITVVEDPEEVTTTTVETTTTSAVRNNTTRPTTTTTAIDKDSTILSYFSNELEATKNNTSTKDKLKNGFITIVDFIFYDGTIKGVTFKELRSATKAKVIYYALLIDAGIDSKFPNYKENISSKYQDIKGRLVAEFLELKYAMCEKSEDGCAQASEDFKLLKYSLNLTWDTVKTFFGYIKNLTVPKIQSWYESFRG